MNYQTFIKSTGELIDVDYFDTKRAMVKHLAAQTGIPQHTLAHAIDAKQNNTLHYDARGYRIEIYYVKGTFGTDDTNSICPE